MTKIDRLMQLADDYATYAATAGIERYLKAIPNRNAELARQALEAELTRLFTPLSDEVVLEKWMDGRVPVLNFVREIEAMHGIGEAK